MGAAATGTAAPVLLPYAWFEYHNDGVLVPTPEAVAMLQAAADNGADGVAMYAEATAPGDPYWAWFEKEGGPATAAWCAAREGGC